MPHRSREQHFSTIIFFKWGWGVGWGGVGLINCLVWSRNGSKIVKFLFTFKSEDCNR